jgi:hypothetical protein
MTIAETRVLLGALGEGKTDQEVKCLHDELAGAANAMFDHLTTKLRDAIDPMGAAEDELPGYPVRTDEEAKRDTLEWIRWTAYLHTNTDDEDAL